MSSQRFKRTCINCHKLFSERSMFSSGRCSECVEIDRIERLRKEKAELIMNNTNCGFCGEKIISHDDYKLKSCLFSLRGYIIPKLAQQSHDNVEVQS